METITVAPGIHADFGGNGKLLGIEVIDASEVVGKEIELSLPETASLVPKVKAKDGRKPPYVFP